MLPARVIGAVASPVTAQPIRGSEIRADRFAAIVENHRRP
jgi:hypothetical protein